MRTANPALQDRFFSRFRGQVGSTPMTIRGTVTKTFILLALVLAAASFSWMQFASAGTAGVSGWVVVGAIVGFVVGLVTVFKPQWAGYTAPVYAVAQGLFIGSISSIFELKYPGIVIQSAALTFGTLFCLLGAYRSGLFPVTDRFRLGMASAMGGLMLFYVATFVLRLFGLDLSFMQGSGVFSIGLSAVVVVIAALNLVLDFDFIEKSADYGAPKYMEWYGAFALMVTLIWLYLEILRLLSKLNDRRS